MAIYEVTVKPTAAGEDFLAGIALAKGHPVHEEGQFFFSSYPTFGDFIITLSEGPWDGLTSLIDNDDSVWPDEEPDQESVRYESDWCVVSFTKRTLHVPVRTLTAKYCDTVLVSRNCPPWFDLDEFVELIKEAGYPDGPDWSVE